MKIGFIGGGNMAEAMISAILKNRLVPAENISVSDVDPNKLKLLKQKYKISGSNNNQDLAEGKDVIILAIKPQILADVMPALKVRLVPDQLIISILAGKSINTLSKGLSHSCLIRSMPNTPAQVGEGMTVWTATTRVSLSQKKLASEIFRSMGEEVFVTDEKFLDMATAVSGSGPAYVFLFVESMIAAAVKLGWEPGTAQKLVIQTLKGSLSLLQKSGKSPGELRTMVTSPGGTTAEAIASFEKGNFNDLVERSVRSAYEKAIKLGS
jgi:pyrroline-5-carboxylate reductase